MLQVRNRWRYVLPLVVGTLLACGDDSTGPGDPITFDEGTALVSYLEANRTYDVHGGFVVKASDVRTTLVTTPTRQYLIDIRSATDFAKGHVDGAVNVALGDLDEHLEGLSPAASSYDKIILICYSGQSAAYAVGVLRALGYENVFSMKWGMSGWHQDFAGPWLNARSNARVTQFEMGASPSMSTPGELPKLSTGKTTGVDIVEVRAAGIIDAGFGPANIDHNALFGNLGGHYIVNFWPATLYEGVGHIPGAINYDPSTEPFLSAGKLKTLPTDKPVVIYCYTGQTSAYIVGYLRVLGYDARTLLYGTNGMIYDRMIEQNVANAFVPGSEIMNYAYVK